MSDTTEIARGKIATITTNDQIAINVGREKGVAKDDIVILYREVQVDDPESGTKLGSVKYVKLRLRVLYVQDRFCVAQVTDRVARSAGSTPVTVPPRKQVTTDEAEASENTVFVELGEVALIRRPAVKVDAAV